MFILKETHSDIPVGEEAAPKTLHPPPFSSHTLPHSSEWGRRGEDNPIPLPPRDRNKALLAAKPRHTRKHPLIIPPTSVQRTLDKVNMVTPPADTPHHALPEHIYSNIAVKNPDSVHFEAEIESSLDALDEIPPEQDVVDSGGGSKSSHHVSCEDLLKFANTKPSSRTRGNDSDEVRIMLKVLGQIVST